jgi:transcriptional regulator with XRE-family HTH domain
MSGISREATRKTFWQAAGTLLGELRTRRGWTRPELAERAGLSADLVSIYETDPERYPELEAWWRLTTAIGVDLGTFLRHVETRAGVRLLHDVRLPQTAVGAQRGTTGMLAPREDAAVAKEKGTDQLSAFVDQLRHKGQGGDSQ